MTHRANMNRIEFYAQKAKVYRQKYGNRTPTRTTVRRWVKEAKEKFSDKGEK